jgi:hypothetical protein
MFDEKLSLRNTLGYGLFLEKLRGKKNKKLIITKNSKNQIEEIDHNKSRHALEVQRSRYLAMNDGGFDDNEDGGLLFGRIDLSKKSIKQLLGINNDHQIEMEKKE